MPSKPYKPHLCDFRSPPAEGHECRTAIWSEGRACRRCDVECYRAGFTAAQATADNNRLVTEKRNA